MTLREMHTRMGVDEYHDWVEYYNAQPFGFHRAEQRHGDLLASLWILHAGDKCPKGLKQAAHWKYSQAESIQDMDAEQEARMMLAKMGG